MSTCPQERHDDRARRDGQQRPPTFRLVVVSAGTSDPSSSRLLADRVAARVETLAGQDGHMVTTMVIELRELATEIATAMTSQLTGPRLQRAIDALAAADGLIVSTPVYKAGPSGLFTSFPSAGQRPAHRQAGRAGRHRGYAAARPRRRRPDAPAVRLPAHPGRADLAVRRAGGLG